MSYATIYENSVQFVYKTKKKMQRNCEKINHHWFHYDKFVNRVGKMSDLQGIFIIVTPRITAGHGIAP